MKTPDQPTLSIGISAYNEAATLPWLLQDIAAQQLPGVSLKEVIVVSDGSTDNTVKLAHRATDLPMVVVDHQNRQGVAKRMNEMCQLATSSVLILLNADIRLEGSTCLSSLILPILTNQADLTSGQQLPLPGTNWLERALVRSMYLKNAIFMQLRESQNIYNCHGTIRALSRSLYTQLRFTHSVGEDAYSYLFAVSHHFRFQFVPQTIVRFREPNTWSDYLKQVKRYQQSHTQFQSEFDPALVAAEYVIPWKLQLQHTLLTAARHPLEFGCYLGLKIASLLTPHRPIGTVWEIATSSKRTK